MSSKQLKPRIKLNPNIGNAVPFDMWSSLNFRLKCLVKWKAPS